MLLKPNLILKLIEYSKFYLTNQYFLSQAIPFLNFIDLSIFFDIKIVFSPRREIPPPHHPEAYSSIFYDIIRTALEEETHEDLDSLIEFLEKNTEKRII